MCKTRAENQLLDKLETEFSETKREMTEQQET